MNSLLDNFVQVKKIEIYAKRWFQRTYGNTYHSSEIYINDKIVHKIEFCYGYGNQYEWNSYIWLKENGYINRHSLEQNLWRYCRENNIEYHNEVVDVKRKKDL